MDFTGGSKGPDNLKTISQFYISADRLLGKLGGCTQSVVSPPLMTAPCSNKGESFNNMCSLKIAGQETSPYILFSSWYFVALL